MKTTGWVMGMSGVLALLLAGAGCGRRSGDAGEAPLAVVGGTAITEEDFAFEVQRRLETGRPLGSPRDILQDLVEREAMLQRAATSTVLEDPVVRRELENQMLVKWLDEALHRERDSVRVSDDELRAAYAARRAAFTRPALTRLAILYRRVTPHDPDETLETVRAELEAARERFLADPEAATRNGRLVGFGVIAADHSEHAVSRYRGGDLGWMDPAREDQRFPVEVLAAGFALEPGGVSGVIEAGDGLYVVMQADRREAHRVPFEEAAAGLRRELIREKQDAVERRFREQLLDQADVVVNTERAAALRMPEDVDRPVAHAPPVAAGTPATDVGRP